MYFALFKSDSSGNPVLAAVSNPVEFKNYNEPLQQHLALTSKLDEMVLVDVRSGFDLSGQPLCKV